MQNRIKFVASLALAAFGHSTALACDRDPWDQVGYPSGVFFASAMMREAAFVDIALAEDRRPFPSAPTPIDLASFRTLSRLKGGSPDVFTLLAPSSDGRLIKDKPDDFGMYVDDGGRVYPMAARGEPQTSNSGVRTSCDPGEITPEPGQLYIIFRGPDGGLLRTARYHGDKPQPALPFRMTKNDGDDWKTAVWTAAGRWREQVKRRTTEKIMGHSNVARVVFRRPLSERELSRLLMPNGPLPFAVRVAAAGGYQDESRVPLSYAGQALIVRAVAAAKDSLRRWRGPELAARLVAAIPTGDPGHGAFDPGVDLLSAARRLEVARTSPAVGIISLELVGTDAHWARLRASPSVANLKTGFTFQGGPAVPPLTLPLSSAGFGSNEKLDRVISDLRALAVQ